MRSGYPIVYQDVMRVVIAGPLGDPRVGVNRRVGSDAPLVMTVSEARELAAALSWALTEYDARVGHESFYPRDRKAAQERKASDGG